ncbi:hypothetical protein V502_06065 [Pseudogymnoascus sp. VKM F-4520 (FW-2644)]|nr:hypothetical protein V502_06065 [Pseudogymnoascus sp. VKM F-4520 (FW-2644)]
MWRSTGRRVVPQEEIVNGYGFANPAAGPLHKIVNGIARSAGQQNNNSGKSSAGWDEGKEADIVGEVSEGRLVGGTRRELEGVLKRRKEDLKRWSGVEGQGRTAKTTRTRRTTTTKTKSKQVDFSQSASEVPQRKKWRSEGGVDGLVGNKGEVGKRVRTSLVRST